MSPTQTKVGHFLAKILRIELQEREPTSDPVTRGESILSIQSGGTAVFVEDTPTTVDWIRKRTTVHWNGVVHYLLSLFPFLDWVPRYNTAWAPGDLVAGVTVGVVVVPQGMAYAILANLPPEYGLYSSFMGVAIYWLFATSKDITIGPVAVMSTVMGNAVTTVQEKRPDFEAFDITATLTILAGAIVLFIGLIRCGWIVDVISLVSLSAFMTGSAINIAVGQLPATMGMSGFSTRDAPYLVFIHILTHFHTVKLDAAMGLTALFFLYLIRGVLNFSAKRYPQKAKLLFFINTLRTAFIILLYTMISWLVNMHRRQDPAFAILGHVPRGLQHAKVPNINTDIASGVAGLLPVTVIVLLVEHIAISKSFGRINNYTINPSQEMVAIGVTNLFSPFVGGYAATGSFSRTAIKSKAGVRTPAAGIITAILVILATYLLPAVFFYIPKSVLSAVIIHAVFDLITPPNTVYQFWRVAPFDVVIFFVGVLVSVFSSIENGIYATVSISVAVLLFRFLRARGTFLGPVQVHSLVADLAIPKPSAGENNPGEKSPPAPPLTKYQDSPDSRVPSITIKDYSYDQDKSRSPSSCESPESSPSTRQSPPTIPNELLPWDAEDEANTRRDVFLPIEHTDGSNPDVVIESPYPGIFIYRLTEGFNYPNAGRTMDYLTEYVIAHTRRTTPLDFSDKNNRAWNDPGPKNAEAAQKLAEEEASLPTLRAIILDFSSVNHVDVTSVQQLIDARNQLDRYTAPDVVDWHIACITNRWTKRALVSAGFGFPPERGELGLHHRWQSIFNVTEIGGELSAAADAEDKTNRNLLLQSRQNSTFTSNGVADEEEGRVSTSTNPSTKSQHNTKSSTSRPSLSKFRSTSSTAAGCCPVRDGLHVVPSARKNGFVLVHGLNRPLFHPDLTSAYHSAVLNVVHRDQVGTDDSPTTVE